MTANISVTYPHAGRFFALFWNTREDANHLVLARSERAAEQCLRRVFERYSHATLGEYFEGEFVAPSHSFEYASTRLKEFGEACQFWNTVCCLREEIRATPENIVPCTRSVPFDENEDPSSHRDCIYCNDQGWRPRDQTIEEAFALHRDAWMRHQGGERKSSSMPSRAERARENEAFHAMFFSPGHHSPGVLAQRHVEPFANQFDTVLFFFRDVQPMKRETIEAMRLDFNPPEPAIVEEPEAPWTPDARNVALFVEFWGTP